MNYKRNRDDSDDNGIDDNEDKKLQYLILLYAAWRSEGHEKIVSQMPEDVRRPVIDIQRKISKMKICCLLEIVEDIWKWTSRNSVV